MEKRYAARLTTIATHSSCSARLAVRQVHTTFAKPKAAASKQTSPNAPAKPVDPGPGTTAPNAPNRVRMARKVSTACSGHRSTGEIPVFGGTIANAPKRNITVRVSNASGTDMAAGAIAASPVRSFRAARTR